MAEHRDNQREAVSKARTDERKPTAPDWLIENIAEASKNARKIYFLYLGFLAYSALTVVSTSDRQIILNETARLPIVSLDVSLNGFFLLTPLMAIVVFIYFQLYLCRLKGLIDDLRTNYSSGEKRRLYPWIVNIAEDPEPGLIGALQKAIVSFSLWASLTFVLILFAFWYVKKHEPIWSYVVGAAPIAGALITFWFWLHYEPGKLGKSTWSKVFSIGGFSVVIMIELCLFIFLIPWALEGGRYKWIRPLICVNLGYQKLVTEPQRDYPSLYWGNLREVHLEGADLTSTVLKRADLRSANLQCAEMRYATLEKADLFGAKLQKADLTGADLRGAILHGASLQGSDLARANLEEADLTRADLQEVSLGAIVLEYGSFFAGGANLLKAKLFEADLRKAHLGQVNLQAADLRNAKLQGAILWAANLRKAKMRNANLQNAQLRGFTIVHDSGKRFRVRSNLQEADLRVANLEGVHLDGANLRATDLKGAKGLTLEQLSRVATLYEARLDLGLLEEIEKAFPHLLVEPKEADIDSDLVEEINEAYPHLLVEPEE